MTDEHATRGDPGMYHVSAALGISAAALVATVWPVGGLPAALCGVSAGMIVSEGANRVVAWADARERVESVA